MSVWPALVSAWPVPPLAASACGVSEPPPVWPLLPPVSVWPVPPALVWVLVGVSVVVAVAWTVWGAWAWVWPVTGSRP